MKHILELRTTSSVHSVSNQIQHYNQEVTVHTLTYSYNSRYIEKCDDIRKFITTCEHYVTQHKIHTVIAQSDLLSLVAAYLNEKFHFPGTSVESVFLSLHKQLTKVVTHTPMASILWNIWEAVPQKKFPFYIKAPYSSLGVLGFKVHNLEEMHNAQQQLQQLLPLLNQPFYEVLKLTTIPQKYSEALEDYVAIEPLIHAPQVTVEGYVFNETVTTLFISDSNFIPGTSLFDNFTVPSQQPNDIQEKLREHTVRDVQAIDLNMTFFNAEYWIQNGKPLLIEINSRCAFSFRKLYQESYDYDLQAALISLAIGKKPAPVPNTKAVAGQFNIYTFQIGSEEKLRQLYEKMPTLKLKIPLGAKQEALGDNGAVAAQFELSGQTFSEIFAKAEAIRAQVR